MMVPTYAEMNELHRLAEYILESNFFDYDNLWDWEQDWNDYVADNYGLTVYSGCTKACFVSTDVDWVIKVNLCHDRDYCYDEAFNYQAAIDYGVEECFAACYFLDRIDGHDFYIQEMVDVDEETSENTCYDYARETCEEEDPTDDDVWDAYYDFDDYSRVNAIFRLANIKAKLIDFIYEYDIDDLHIGNFGYKGEKPVIIDYSGY